jgi:glycosyltransferase involved in cell wall biosynthesis
MASEVIGHLHSHSPASHHAAAAALNTFDVAIVQHEYGIYGGQDGDQLLAVLEQVRVPIVTVVHTVLVFPTPHQADVMRNLIAASRAVVTMTDAARDRLIHGYQVDPAKVRVIRQGADARHGPNPLTPGRRPLILTWGLLGPGKGIEWAIDGLQRLQRLHPQPAYIVAGQTHPRARMQDGESYRLKLAQRARAVGVARSVRFIGSYLDDEALTRLIDRADMVLLPYDSREQATSSVLVEAVAAGKPVVATAFPHAVELLGNGAGLLVPHFDGRAIGEAMYRVLTEPDLARHMVAEAMALAPTFRWSAAAEQYRSLATSLLEQRTPVTG